MACGYVRDEPVVVQGEGLILREWEHRDVAAMVELFDTAEMDRWTPLSHPFDTGVATRYVQRAHQGKRDGTLQLAITTDGTTPLGEVLMFAASEPEVCEFAYAVGAAHRGQALATRAIKILLPLARAEGYRTATLTIAGENTASQAVACAAGFRRDETPLQRRERKGYVLYMATWTRSL